MNSAPQVVSDHEPGGVVQIVNPKNLALLHKRDRLVIMAAGLVVIAALGAVAALRAHPAIAMTLVLASIGVVAGLVILVQSRAISLHGIEADLHFQAEAAKSVNGDWWQIVKAADHPGLSHVAIAISEVAERHALQGITFDENGSRVARFSSDVVAVKTSTPVEIYYIWRGTVLNEKDARVVSGIGRFRFDSVGRERRPMEAEGAFTRGTPDEFAFDTARAVELIRFSDRESERLAADPNCLGELAREAFPRFAIEGGRTLGEAPR